MGAHQSNKPRIGSLIHESCITERLGKSTSNSVKFDDGAFLANKFNFKLCTVNIWTDKNYITGIQAVYEMDGTKVSPGCHLGGSADKKATLNLGSDEYIVRAYIRSGNLIDGIRLETSKGNFIEVGGLGGELTLFDVPQGCQFVAFTGETSKYLETLQIRFDKIW
jgi:hypothetical protein